MEHGFIRVAKNNLINKKVSADKLGDAL